MLLWVRHGRAEGASTGRLHAELSDRGYGFFLGPADPRSNNLPVFVTAAGMQHVRFLCLGLMKCARLPLSFL